MKIQIVLTSLLAVSILVTGAQSEARRNLAVVATPTTSYVSGHETITALNDGGDPANSGDKSRGAYGNWPRTGTQWVEYAWSQPVSLSGMDVYWFDDRMGVRLPTACRLQYWEGGKFVAVPGAVGLRVEDNRFNHTSFPEIRTTRLRLEFDGRETFSTGLLEWRVYDSGGSPNFAPVVDAGVDRVVVRPGETYLEASVQDDAPLGVMKLRWEKQSGPGRVELAQPDKAETTARFSKPGEYILQCRADDGQLSATDTVRVRVVSPPAAAALTPLWPEPYTITSPFWEPRLKNQIVNWIPHCVAKIDDLALPEGGIENFVQAGKKLAGKEARHTGAPFANAWVYNVLEAMCFATMVEFEGDAQVRQEQERLRAKIEEWVGKILSAQEPDGYVQTMYTINGIPRWSNKHDHEGYNASYFMEAAMAHFQMSGGKDRRMTDAAFRLGDCWVRNVGPAPKRSWYEGHAGLELTLMRLGRFSEQHRGPGTGRDYMKLARFLFDCRKNGEEYDQSHIPVTRQYAAVGHAVRAVYTYAGMTDVAMQSGDVDYHSALLSVWDNLINRKYYVTGGVGSGETSEGFGKDYSLPNNSYCESCAGCGQIFFQSKMNLVWQEARYADLVEEALYNAVLGSVDLDGQNFTYTNPLDSQQARYKWHVCPCCVGNIPRTMLVLPSWMYARGENAIYVNLYIGSKARLGTIGGAEISLRQETSYPNDGRVKLTVEASRTARFALHLRMPDTKTSELYTLEPAIDGRPSVRVNGQVASAKMDEGYLVLDRKWKAGDTVEWTLPMVVQRIRPDPRIQATRGRVALRYGPLIYSFESVDQKLEGVLRGSAPLEVQWRPDLLGGVNVIRGEFADGSPLLAIPNYARLNRGGRSVVWIKAE